MTHKQIQSALSRRHVLGIAASGLAAQLDRLREPLPPGKTDGPTGLVPDELLVLGKKPHVVGGALEAGELDAKKAIDQAARLAARL